MDKVSLDQLRTLAAVVDAGSFSAAARRLRRVQSAVSTAMANLEEALGVPVWDRTKRAATLTPAGQAVLAAARRVIGEADALGTLAQGIAAGVEPRVSLCVDAIFPIAALVELCRQFARAFPAVDLRVDVQTMSVVAARVVDGRATLGVATAVAQSPALERHALAAIRMVPVCAPEHPLAKRRGKLPAAMFAEHVQIVLSERSETGVPDQAVLGERTWRVDDLHTKRALLLGGLGWGNLPEHMAREDLERKRLVTIRPEAWAPDEFVLHLAVVHRRDATLGPAHRWLLERLPVLCANAM